jgi:hypothetical protein
MSSTGLPALFFVIATNVALILMITVFRRKILDA